ncbi:MAG TPA: TlpA disulfide reductase family protein [Polyangiales bacterium]|nr:TlpA disulfide reductase family protein [Polyangiales bacterium]
MSAGCAGTQVSPSTPVLDLTLNGLDGRNLELSALRGKPVLLFLFATYDPISQIALTPLLAAGKSESRVTIIGVAVQPDAREFLGPFAKALEVPFALYYDGSGALLHGKTKLGALPGVPLYIAVDAEGYVHGTFYGVAKAKDLEALIDSAE